MIENGCPVMMRLLDGRERLGCSVGMESGVHVLVLEDLCGILQDVWRL